MSKTEKWFPIRGYTGLYEMTKTGRIRSCDRRVRVRRNNAEPYFMNLKGKELTPLIIGNSYGQVNLCKNGECANVSISKLLKQFNGRK